VGNFFQGSCDYHGLTVATTTAMLGPTVKLWQLGCTKHAQVVGQWTPWAARCGFRGRVTRFAVIWLKKCQLLYPSFLYPSILSKQATFYVLSALYK